MKPFNRFNRNKKVDEREASDPRTPTGIDRRTVVIALLAIAIVVTTVLIASNSSPPKMSGAAVSPTVDTDPTYAGVFQIPTQGVIEDAEIEGLPPAWESPMSARPSITDDDEREAAFASARRSGGGLFFNQEADGLGTDLPSSTPQGVIAQDDRTILEGTIIPAVLETAIDSDRPGPVAARILHDVRDTKTLSNVLIPAGTRVLGEMTTSGLSVALTWHRMVFPDGSTMQIPNLPSLDDGGGGVAGEVDRHRFARAGSATLWALLGATSTVAGAQLTDQGGIYGGALALQLGQVGSRTMQQVARPPTITVPVGYTFEIWVESDLTIP